MTWWRGHGLVVMFITLDGAWAGGNVYNAGGGMGWW